MRKFILLLFVMLLGACATEVPVKQNFPDVPSVLIKKCENLIKIDENTTSIAELMKTVAENYRMYYECSEKVSGWNEWYENQKKLFDSTRVKK